MRIFAKLKKVKEAIPLQTKVMANEEIEKMLDNSSEVLDALHAEFLKSIKASLQKHNETLAKTN